jgi:hypothetical protein
MAEEMGLAMFRFAVTGSTAPDTSSGGLWSTISGMFGSMLPSAPPASSSPASSVAPKSPRRL